MSAAKGLLANQAFQNRFESILDAHMPGTFPALSICVISQDEIVLDFARGWIDPDTRQLPVSTHTLFDLASVTKLFVESSFLVLVDAGKVEIDSRLVAVIPEFGELNPRAISGGQDPHTRAFLPVDSNHRDKTVDVTEVSCKHLLTHSSGLPPWRSVYLSAADCPPALPTAASRYVSERWNSALKALVRFPLVGSVGDTVRYSDIGIMLLGEAVARLHGKRLDQAVRDVILDPLELNSVTYNPVMNGVAKRKVVPTELDSSWRCRRAWGEVHDENACGVGGIAGHAGLFATARDVARFGQAWLTGDKRLTIGGDLRKLATSQQAHGQFRLGLGWMLKGREDSSAGDLYHDSSYGHTGFTGTSLWIDPTRRLVSAVLTNRVYHGRQEQGIHSFRRAMHDLIVEGIDSR